MQQVRVKEIKSKSGKIKSGARMGEDYELVIIIADDGSEFTTFDTAIKEVGTGGLLELEAVIKNNKTNITSFKILEKGTASKSPNGGRPGMTPELWAEKDRLERGSMEAMSAFRGIMDLAKVWPTDAKAQNVIGVALDWALARLEQPSEAARTYQVSKPAPTPAADKGFTNAGEFLKSCLDILGMNKSDVLEALSISDVSEIKNLDATYKGLAEIKAKSPF